MIKKPGAIEMSVRCLLLAANYPGTRHELRGCVNDAENLSEFLVQSGCASQDHIKLVCEPTRSDIIDSIGELASESTDKGIDRVFISFSGHGSSLRDTNGDEEDGWDEALVPVDYARNGLVSDDDLCELFSQFSSNTKISVLFDCCHSGTALDLPFRFVGCTQTSACNAAGSKCHANTVMISGCKDAQTSADAYDKDRCEFSGAMTSAMLDVLKLEPTVGSDAFALVTAMRVLLKERGMSQIPQLCSSQSSDQCSVPEFLPPTSL